MTQPRDNTSNLQYATKLVGAGYKVFPCCWPTPAGTCGCPRHHINPKEIGKAPLTPHAHINASSKSADVFNWWKEWPQANIGIALDGLLMVDPDSDEAQAEILTWSLPPTVVRRSRQDALIYRIPKDFPQKRLTKKGDSGEIDLLSDGYCLAYGLHQGQRPVYLESFDEPAMAPASLLDRFKAWLPVDPPPRDPDIDHSGDPPVRLTHEALEWWTGVKFHAGQNGAVDRSETLFRLGGMLQRAGATEQTIVEAIQERDATLYGKYTDRRDAPIRYAEIARRVSTDTHSVFSPPMGDTSVFIAEEPQWDVLGALSASEEAPELPEEMVPEAFRPWLRDIARQACFPLEMVAGPAIVAASIVIGRKLGIKPWRFSDYTVVPNLWGAINARPAQMKSYAIEEATKPLKRLALAAREQYDGEKAFYQAEAEALKAEAEALKAEIKAAAKGKGEKSMADLKAALVAKLRQIEDSTVKQRRYWVGDSTPEKLADLMSENPNGLLVVYDELGGWVAEMERKGREGSRDFYLASWEGRGSHQIDRIARGEIFIKSVCLSVIGGIQPDRLRKYLAEAISGSGGGDGMIQRFQMLITIERLHEWEPPDRWASAGAKTDAYEAFQWLDRTPLGDMAETGEVIPYLTFTRESQEAADVWRKTLEDRVRGQELAHMPAFEAHLGKYRSLMPSLALIFHLLDVYMESPNHEGKLPGVSLEALTLAADWCDYLECHARKVYEPEITPGIDATAKLAGKIREGSVPNGISIRDIFQHHWGGLDTSDKVDQAAQALEAIGWVKVVTHNTGGRPSRVMLLHPDLRGFNNGKV